MNKKVKKQKKGKIKKNQIPGNKKAPGMSAGAGTKCRFCKKTVPLAMAWNCCYGDKYDTAINFERGIAKLIPKEEVETIDVQTPGADSDGES